MKRIILRIEIGDWNGGNNGQYPKLIEYVPTDEKSPFYESEGWGHGLGGGCSSIRKFVSSDSFKQLEKTNWAYNIIKEAYESGGNSKELGVALSEAYKTNKPSIPSHLEEYLTNS